MRHINLKIAIVILVLCHCGISKKCCGEEVEFPKVSVTKQRLVFDNGEHNAFTDLTWFKGKIYLAFRSCPDGHMVFPSSRIVILRSSDGRQWKQIHQFSIPNRDTRDPHFATLNGNLFVYTGTWYCGSHAPKIRNLNQMVGYGASTEDGVMWSKPRILAGTYGHYVWRAATFNRRIYLCARRTRAFAEVANPAERAPLMRSLMLASEDGFRFQPVAAFQEQDGDETAFMFDQAGNVTAVGRRGRGNAELIRMSSTFDKKERIDLGRYIGGPLIRKFGEYTIVAGRNVTSGKAVTSVYWLAKNKLYDMCELPSGGDCSYPGMVQLCPGCMLVSYYSSHESDSDGKPATNIYLAELEF